MIKGMGRSVKVKESKTIGKGQTDKIQKDEGEIKREIEKGLN